MTSKRIWLNEDNASFYVLHDADQMTEAGCRALVDRYVDAGGENGGLAGLSFCANVQRALFPSQVWDRLWDGYDPDGADDQPALTWLAEKDRRLGAPNWGRTWVHHLHLLEQRGVDHLAVWLDQSRQRGVEGWLSMRMNDVHHVDKPQAFWHNSLWSQHPELRRATYRDEGWFEHAYDYAHDAVVQHHLALMNELLTRYDCDGLEIDWVRWVRHSRPGHELQVAAQLTHVMREARRLANLAAVRLGHPVRIAARLPADPTAAYALGYDLPTWNREKLVDRVILAPFFQQAAFAWDIGLWRGLLPDAEILVQPESMMIPWPDAGEAAMVHDYRFLVGGAAAALAEGADGVWLFNECYRFAQHDSFGKVFGGTTVLGPLLLKTIGDINALRDTPRRQVLSYHQITGPGRPAGSRLPASLARPSGNYDFGRFRDTLALPLSCGPIPDQAPAHVVIGVDAEVDLSPFRWWLNGHALPTPQVHPGIGEHRPGASRTLHLGLPPMTKANLVATIPPGALHAGTNLVEILAPGAPGRVVWAEIAIACAPWLASDSANTAKSA